MQPGPGGYEEKTSIGQGPYATIKGKIFEKPRQGPGPGEYDQDAAKDLAPKQGSVRIGRAERKHIWEQQLKAGEAVPGPGGYDEKSTLADRGMTFGQKREEKISQLPGPGEYE